MTGHTPGRWTIYADTHVMAGDRLVAGCGGHSSNVDSDKIRAENAANARLIAAAPAMLEALRVAEKALAPGMDGARERIRNAIAQAEPETGK